MVEAQQPVQANMLSARDKPSKVRHRASVACQHCRQSRTRCVVPVGESSCTQCKDIGQQCVIKHDDERRKPNSKAYVNSLRDKIAHLESLLEDREQRVSESKSPVSSNAGAGGSSYEQQELPCENADTFEFSMPQLSATDFASFAPQELPLNGQSPANSAHSTSSSSRSTISRLLSTKGHLSFDQLSGRLRWFGPTTNCHVHSELAGEYEESNRQAMEQQRRTQRVLSTLPQETQEYLMNMFWQYYNSVIHVIHRGAFEEGMNAGQGQFYSPFLHICILGIGYRHADKSRPDIMKISLPGKESTLHREAKYMLDYELERPGGVTSIQALLLLGDLECGVGRDNLGWLISGMAMRILFDAGLHLAHQDGLSQLETEIRRMTLWACVIYDRYWALFLGRPTALKPEDLEVYRLAQQFERLGTLEPAGPSKSLEKQIYEALLDLMELAGKITEIMDKASKPNVRLDQHVYVTCSALNYELETWYARLPRPLQWSAENIDGAPFSYFLLHQQYHAAIILLHRQFAQYDDIVASSSEQGSENGEHTQIGGHFATLSRMTCTKSAGKMAQIFWQHRQHYDTKKIFVTGLQHAGTAAIALVAAVASPKDRTSYDTNMRHLECLAASINDMCETYQPAERMSAVLKAVIEELKTARPQSTYSSTVPARRGSSTDRDGEDESQAKRHQSGRSSVHRTKSQLPEPPAFLHDQPRRHTTTGMPPPDMTSFVPRSDGVSTAQTDTEPQNAFDLMNTESTLGEVQPSWTKFDDASAFSIDESAFMSGFGRPASPGQFRSAWMGAETPTFSPIPTGTSATAFTSNNAMQDFGDRTNGLSTTQSSDVFTANTNLDFMTLLNATDASNTMNEHMEISTNGATSQQNKTQAFESLPTPKSQTPPNETNGCVSSAHGANGASNVLLTPPSDSRPQSRQRSESTTKQRDSSDKGFSRTMAGLDDIWKEMMRTSQTSSKS